MLTTLSLSKIEDYLLVNQLEISSMTKRGQKFIVALSNKYSQRLMYVLTFNYWCRLINPDFSYKAMHSGTPISVPEMTKLKNQVEKILDEHISTD